MAEATHDRTINGAGVPLSLQDGTEVYAISCSAPAFQLSAERRRDEIGPRLVAVAAAIRGDLEGHAHPD